MHSAVIDGMLTSTSGTAKIQLHGDKRSSWLIVLQWLHMVQPPPLLTPDHVEDVVLLVDKYNIASPQVASTNAIIDMVKQVHVNPVLHPGQMYELPVDKASLFRWLNVAVRCKLDEAVKACCDQVVAAMAIVPDATTLDAEAAQVLAMHLSSCLAMMERPWAKSGSWA